MSRVIFTSSADYDYKDIRRHVGDMLEMCGGSSIKRGSVVLVKPNLLAPAGPETAIVTHPHIVRAAVEYVIEKGAHPQVSDSPAIGSFEKVLEKSGLRDCLRGYDVVFREFGESTVVDVGEPFKKIEVARDALKASFVINLPKLKSHTQMLLTLGVKNIYGCIVGLRKPEWHFRTGVNRALFAKLLVQTCMAVNPSVTILDGILAMEGQGPGRGGIPRRLGVLIASNNPVSLDMAVCRMLGIDPFSLMTNRAALDMGLADSAMEIEGEMSLVRDFKFPEIIPLVFGPKSMHGFMRRHLVQRPVCTHSNCHRCGECWRYCPARAISLKGRKISFDYEKCIRCYCCLEVCPYGALRAEEPGIGRVIKKIMRYDRQEQE
ncbi:MAG: hypothetical protein C0402_06770 [Thermodesulfovibrio sp.]|nr:hypothetical protein [Thermodesulfovibrio sp.]